MMAYIDEDGNISSMPPDPKKRKIYNPEDIQIGVPKYEETEEELVKTGKVSFFDESKGFGFISRDSGDDIFVHFRAIRGEGHRILVEGQRVEFSVMHRDKGLQAEDVVAVTRR